MSFRESYLDHEALTNQLREWERSDPAFVRVQSIGRTEEGRDLWLLTIGPDPDEPRPALWVDGNMHASELAGSSVALAIAEDLIQLHRDPSRTIHGLPPHVCGQLRRVKAFVLPRVSPDGAEAVLKEGRWVRSVPRLHARLEPRFVAQDLDGDGLTLLMRVEDPTGEMVESTVHPGLMVPRQLDDPPPYYKVYPEGLIDGWDGQNVPDPHYLDDNYPDLNRNFPFDWAPEHQQKGAGDYPGSEPESRAVIEFATAHPEIAVWINYHCFGGVFIRPRGDVPDTKMEPADLAVYRQLGAWAEELTRYPMVSGFEEFTYSPETPLRGDLIEWAYAARGAVAFVCELWDLWAQLGHERPKRFVDHYSKIGRSEVEGFAAWDREHNQGRALRPWKKVQHPQLGAVEVGGLDPRVGVWNPPPEKLGAVCGEHAQLALRTAALVPRVEVDVTVEEGPGDTRTLRVVVQNLGYLPTHVVHAGKQLHHNEGLWAELELDGPERLGPSRQEVGHLDGWGRGLHGGDASFAIVRTKGTTARRELRWTVRGSGEVRVRVGGPRVGFVTRTVSV